MASDTEDSSEVRNTTEGKIFFFFFLYIGISIESEE